MTSETYPRPGQREPCRLELTLLRPSEVCPACGWEAKAHRFYPRPGHINYNPSVHEIGKRDG